MSIKNKTKNKIISALFIVLVLTPFVLFSFPKKTAAGGIPVHDIIHNATSIYNGVTQTHIAVTSAATSISTTTTAANTTKQVVEQALKQLIMNASQRLLVEMTKSTINWINTGFHGAPLFVENPGSFFKDIGKSEVRDLVSIIGNDSASQPFGRSTAENIINSYKSSFEQNSQYSLSKVISDEATLNNYRTDFSYGGWNGFLLNTQYPQNNFVGYNILVSNELARRLKGTATNKADMTRELLQQGQGFLSPQICTTNESYNNLTNPFNKPRFSVPQPDCPDPATENDAYLRCIAPWEQQRHEWEAKNTCPDKDGRSGLVNTTPGYVVANQITKALNVPIDKATLAGVVGNSLTDSLSAIMDALLNKLASSGLNALSKGLNGSGKSNNPNSSITGTGSDWASANQTVVLSTFKADVQSAIDNGTQEIKIINGNSDTSGILQVYNNTFPKIQALDMCLPGPNYGWETRIDAGAQNTVLNSTDENQTNSSYDALKVRVDAFKVWISNKIKAELPSSNIFLNSVNNVKNINQDLSDLNARSATISETLNKLNSIKSELDPITSQPNPGSSAAATLSRLKQRYDDMLLDISSASTVSDAQNKLADAKDKLASLSAQITNCGSERTTKGWSNPGGASSTNGGTTEQNAFCDSYTNPPVSCDEVFRTDASDYRKN